MKTEVMGNWKKNTSQFTFYSRYYKGNQIKNLRWTGHTAQRKAIRNSRKHRRADTIWKTRSRGEVNIKRKFK